MIFIIGAKKIKFSIARFLLFAAISLLSLLSEKSAVEYESTIVFSLVSFLCLTYLVADCRASGSIAPLFSINYMLAIYSSLCWLIGSFLYMQGSLLIGHNVLGIFSKLENLDYCWSYIIASIGIVCSIQPVHSEKYTHEFKQSKLSYRIVSLAMGFVFVGLGILRISLTLIGGSGSLFAQCIQTGSFAIFATISNLRSSTKLFFAIPIAIFSLQAFYEEKREFLALLLLSTLFLAGPKWLSKLNFYKFLAILVLMIIVVLAVIVQSIARGYGGFIQGANDGFFASFAYIYQFIKSPEVLSYLANNFEFSSMFLVGSIATSLGLSQPFDSAPMGTTFYKVFFVPLTIAGVPKPESFITIITNHISPGYRFSEGGSYPAFLPSELIFNFNIIPLALFFLFAFSIVFAWITSGLYSSSRACFYGAGKVEESVLYANLFAQSLFLWRGQGLDMMLVAMIPGTIYYLSSKLIRACMDEKLLS
jgi:hypothetical protein